MVYDTSNTDGYGRYQRSQLQGMFRLDKISHTGLHSALEAFGLDPLYLRMIDALYADPQFKARSAGSESAVHSASSVAR